jgi:hypothetical protein
MKIKTSLLRKSNFMPLQKFAQAQSRLDEFFHHYGLRASLVIPSGEAKDENQNIFASQI